MDLRTLSIEAKWFLIGFGVAVSQNMSNNDRDFILQVREELSKVYNIPIRKIDKIMKLGNKVGDQIRAKLAEEQNHVVSNPKS